MLIAHQIEVLLFDLGGVVIEIDFERAFQQWQQHSSLSIEAMRRRFSMDAAYQQHERGEIEGTDYFQHLRDLLELDGSDEEIALGWNAIFTGEITESVNDILSISEQQRCFLFSNSNTVHQTTWMADYPRAIAAFERIFVSSDLGLRKPDRAAFEFVAQAIGVRVSAILFFDDTLENVTGAQAAGLQAVHVRSPSDIKQALIDIGAF